MVSSSLSASGDILILSTVLLSFEARRLLTVRLIACFALADLFGQMPLLGSFPLQHIVQWGPIWPGGLTWCELQAAGNWFALLSSWLWTVAYAHTVNSAMPFTRGRADCCNGLSRIRIVETHYHLFCWGLPTIAVGTALASGRVPTTAQQPNAACAYG